MTSPLEHVARVAVAATIVAGAALAAPPAHPATHYGHNPSPAPALRIAPTTTGAGYHTLDTAGGVFTHGDAAFHGSVPWLRQQGHEIGAAGVVDLEPTPAGDGYWAADEVGGLFAFGEAPFHGSLPGLRGAGHQIGLGRVVDMAPTATGDGYHLVDEQGGVFAFGDGRFHGSVPGLRAQGEPVGPARVVGMAPHPDGAGYWLLDDRGGVFAFGSAPYLGSLPARGVAAEAVAIDPSPGGDGYWVATVDGGIHAFGSARFHGSAAGSTWGSEPVDFAADPAGPGYWLLLGDGSVYAFPAPAFAASVAPVTADDLSTSWRPGCPVAPEHLRLLAVSHWGFDGAVHRGRVVVHVDHVDDVRAVFHDLYDARFPIERMEPVDAFGGSDDASMEANNTSAFNCRTVAGSSSWSEHAYGRAIDVNPVQNPFVRGSTVEPEAGRAHLDRTAPATGKIRAGDPVVGAFAARGWGWGGDWTSSRDYQHFSATGR